MRLRREDKSREIGRKIFKIGFRCEGEDTGICDKGRNAKG